MMRTPFTHLVLSLVALVVAIGGAVAVSLLVVQERAQVGVLQTEIAEKQAEAIHIAAAQAALPALSGAEQSLSGYTVRSSEIVPFLEQIGKQGKGQGANVQVVSVNPVQVGGVSRIALALKVDGTYDAVVRTIGTMEYAPYDITLTNLTLTSVLGDTKVTQWSAAVTLSIGTDMPAQIKK